MNKDEFAKMLDKSISTSHSILLEEIIKMSGKIDSIKAELSGQIETLATMTARRFDEQDAEVTGL